MPLEAVHIQKLANLQGNYIIVIVPGCPIMSLLITMKIQDVVPFQPSILPFKRTLPWDMGHCVMAGNNNSGVKSKAGYSGRHVLGHLIGP